MKMPGFRYEAGIFDGTEEGRRHLRGLGLAKLRDLPHGQRMEVAVACDAMAVGAGVIVGPDGTVSRLNVPMQVDPSLAAEPMSDPHAYARFVGGSDAASFIIVCLDVCSLNSDVPAVPTMVLEVIPAPCGTATSFITEAISVHVHEVNRGGGHVIRASSDGDSTYVQKLGKSFRLLADPVRTICAPDCTVERGFAGNVTIPSPTLVTASTSTSRGRSCAT
jgi:hypothetical protein